MTNQLKPLSMALVLVLGTLAASSANAELVRIVDPVKFSSSASVTDIEGGDAATNDDGASLGSTELRQFNASWGVLTGATVNLVSTRTQTTQVKADANGGAGINYDVTSNGTGSSTAQLTIPGGESPIFGSVTQGDQCDGKVKSACIGSASSSTLTDPNTNISSTALDSFVGTGMVEVSRLAPTLSAQQISSVFDGAESTKTTLTWAGTLSATYTYLEHAASSFSGTETLGALTLDFGLVLQNSAPAPLAFSIFNGSGIDRVGLDLDLVSIIDPSGLPWLNANLTGFTGLGAGASKAFWASLNTSALGAFATSYTLNLSDADEGAASSRNNYSLTLNLKGTVQANQLVANDVPEPGSLALLALGLLGVAASVRRRKV